MSQKEAGRRKDHSLMENHLYECLYYILYSNIPQEDKLPVLKHYKAKIVRLHTLRMNNVMPDNSKQRQNRRRGTDTVPHPQNEQTTSRWNAERSSWVDYGCSVHYKDQ